MSKLKKGMQVKVNHCYRYTNKANAELFTMCSNIGVIEKLVTSNKSLLRQSYPNRTLRNDIADVVFTIKPEYRNIAGEQFFTVSGEGKEIRVSILHSDIEQI